MRSSPDWAIFRSLFSAMQQVALAVYRAGNEIEAQNGRRACAGLGTTKLCFPDLQRRGITRPLSMQKGKVIDDTRQHCSRTGHGLQGPHQEGDDSMFEGSAVAPLGLVVLPEGTLVEVARPVVLVGRHSDMELRLACPEVSRRHCRLVFQDGVWHVHDLDSLNGLYVNEERMQEAAIYEGDRIRIGTATLVVTAAPVAARKLAGPATEVLRSIAEALPQRAV